jgi:hypothetical protein
MLKVLAIPPNKPCIRKDYPRQLHRTDAAAMKRRDRIIEEACLSGRPLLIGTATTSASESIYKSVKKTLETAKESIMFKIEYERMLQQGVCFSARPHASTQDLLRHLRVFSRHREFTEPKTLFAKKQRVILRR